MRTKILLAVAGLAMFVTPFLSADEIGKANIPFAFSAGGKVLPPGEYRFRVDMVGGKVTIMNESVKGPGVLMPFITTMAAPPHSTATDCHLVFDKVKDSYTLSELWQPGADGVLVHATKGAHEHHLIHVPR